MNFQEYLNYYFAKRYISLGTVELLFSRKIIDYVLSLSIIYIYIIYDRLNYCD